MLRGMRLCAMRGGPCGFSAIPDRYKVNGHLLISDPSIYMGAAVTYSPHIYSHSLTPTHAADRTALRHIIQPSPNSFGIGGGAAMCL